MEQFYLGRGIYIIIVFYGLIDVFKSRLVKRNEKIFIEIVFPDRSRQNLQ
jgi:hypothetical protein